MDVLKQTASTIKKHRMLTGGEKVLIALSGGPDSSCLASVLTELSRELDLTLFAHYVDHGLRPEETPAEIEQCAALCKSLGIEFTHSIVNVDELVKNQGINKQEAARELRYKALEEAASACGAKRTALGHTLDDQAETFLMRVIRGSGPSGLSGIPPVRGAIIRPLIGTRKPDILEYLREKGIGYAVDSSNLKDKYLRNRLRQSVMPVLEEINPSIVDTLGRTTEILADEERYFFIEVTKALMRLITSKADDHIELFLTPLETLDNAIARRVLRRAIAETSSLRRLGYAHIEEILSLVRNGKPGDSIDLPHKVKVIKKYSTFLITTAPPVHLETRTMDGPGVLEIKEAGMKLEAQITGSPPDTGVSSNVCVLDAGTVSFPLTVRARQDGDFFFPQGFGGKRKKLQDFFVDKKVPRFERNSVPVVLSGKDIIWVAGYRTDERYSVSDATKEYLILKV